MRDSAIRSVYPSIVTITIYNNETTALDNDNNVVALDEALITAEISRLQAEYDANQYARDRAEAYPSLTEQADMAYWDRQNNTTTLDDAISAVKDTYPKPGE
jgi:hypothetical protein